MKEKGRPTARRCPTSRAEFHACVKKTTTKRTSRHPKETFAIWAAKVQAVCRDAFEVPAEDIKIEKMETGGFNRVTSIIVLSGEKTGRYVLRAPHNDDCIASQVSTLKALKPLRSFQIPEVVAYSLSNNNALGKRYMIQRRIEGEALGEVWHSLDSTQKQSPAKEVINIFHEIAALENKTPGRYMVSGTDAKLEPLRVKHVRQEESGPGLRKNTLWTTSSVSGSSPLALMLALCESQAKWSAAHCPKDRRIWRAFTKITESLAKRGFLSEDYFSLVHGDLYPQNILVGDVGKGKVTSTGVIDWDSAITCSTGSSAIRVVRPPY